MSVESGTLDASHGVIGASPTDDPVRDRVVTALTWAPRRPGVGGFLDGMVALDEIDSERHVFREALLTICDIGETRDVVVARKALGLD